MTAAAPPRARTRDWALALLVIAAAPLTLAGPARAGTWMQASCVNPNGSASTSEGWSSGIVGPPDYSDVADTRCAPGTPLVAELSTVTPAPGNTGSYLHYTPPAGSTLVGGRASVTLDAEGYETGNTQNASGFATVYSPQLVNDKSDTIKSCFYFEAPCGNPNTFSGTVTLPSDAGGGFYAQAGCGSFSSPPGSCKSGGNDGTWSFVRIASADFLLSSNVSPTGTGFDGSALARRVRGTGHVVFTAGESAGPGIYQAQVALDGNQVWSGSPNTNGGECVPAGTDASGALIFDHQQPCLTSEVVDVPVPTKGLSDGAHELAITVIDAAGNSATVLDRTINTSNAQTTPKPRGARAIHAQFVIHWHWKGPVTQLRSIAVHRLPRTAGVSISCTGRRCPPLALTHADAPQIKQLLRSLRGRRFRAGDQLRIDVTQRHHRPEHIALTFRSGREPLARLLKR